MFENKLYFLKNMVARYFEVDTRTITRYIEQNYTELVANGYEIFRGNKLKAFIFCTHQVFGKDINVSTKTTVLGLFNLPARLVRIY
ncbi:MAG: hypothetical protein ACYCYI_05160 [Saccharofermentanales bacterium]